MGDENPIRTLGDYSKPSHEGYRNTIELLIGNNVDFLKLVDSLDLDGENKERTRLRLFQFSLRDQASNWLERLPAGSITTWEDLTTRFLAQFFPPGRTAKLRNDILIFQQYHGESLSEASETRFKDFQRLMEAHLAPTQPTQVNKITTSCEICSGPHDTQYCMEDPEQAFVEYASSRTDEAGGKWYTFKPEQNNLGDTYNPSWKSHPNLRWRQPQNSQNNFSNPPNRFQPNDSIPNRSFNNRPQNFNNQSNIEGLVSNFMASQDARLSKFEADFKQQQSEMTNKIDTMLNAITDRIAGTLPSDTVKNPKLGTHPVLFAHKYVESLELSKNGSVFVQGEISVKMGDPGLFTLPCRLGDSKPFDTLADLGSCVNIIPLYLFKKINIGLLEETDHVFGLADGTKSYPVRIVRDVEVHIGKLKLLNNFYVLDMKKYPKTPLLVGRGFLATANAVIDCRMAKIVIGEGITRSVFGVKGVDLGEEEAPYWTTLGKTESYKPRPSSDRIGGKPPYYARKDFLDCHLPGEWEISRDVELNSFKDTLVFSRMVEFLGAIPINLKCNIRNQRT
ncbi:MAK10-like protein [Tanacetum coccineum]